ncbi:MAG: signal recognition particle-docking protein FtsY [Lachnospiraceae bacterium]|nr:signal recognition particle-docking protein FtsY [Lachnospiraceae bacterium]
MEKEKSGFFAKLKNGLNKTRINLLDGLDGVFHGFSTIDDDFYEELEEVLVMADIGVVTSSEIIEEIKTLVKVDHIKNPEDCREYLINLLSERINTHTDDYSFENEKSIIFVIGVNGVGKTTTIGKLAHNFKEDNKKVLIAAADTFRAAATEQLEAWAERVNVPMVKAKEGTDPASVIFDALQSAKAKDVDILLCDTAGRLHNKKNLMEELKKMNRVIDREFPGIHRENFLVLDASTGQNALNQAKEFKEACDITGIILTKMDGTAKGGIAIAIWQELKIPVKYIGVGEGIEDLQKFDSKSFVSAIFDNENN